MKLSVQHAMCHLRCLILPFVHFRKTVNGVLTTKYLRIYSGFDFVTAVSGNGNVLRHYLTDICGC